MGIPYTRAEKKILRERYAAGISAALIATELARTERSVYHQAQKMRLKHSRLYTRAVCRQIRELHAAGKSPEEIAQAVHRPYPGLCRKMCKMRLFSGREFTKLEERIIRRLKKLKFTARQIAAELPGRDLESVRGKIQRMGLSDKRYRKMLAARAARKMNNQQHELFCRFLRLCTERVEPIPALEIMLLWNKRSKEASLPEVTRDKVEYWLGKLKLPCLSGKDVKRKAPTAFARRQLIKLTTLHQGLAEQDEAALDELRELRNATFDRDDTVAAAYCPRCPESEEPWPVTPDFFYFHRDAAGTPRPSLGMCIACTKKHRRQAAEMRARKVPPGDIIAWQKGVAKQARARMRQIRFERGGTVPQFPERPTRPKGHRPKGSQCKAAVPCRAKPRKSAPRNSQTR